jgi:hypothetical protein
LLPGNSTKNPCAMVKCLAILPPFSLPLPGTCHLAKTTACGKNVRAISTRQTTQSPFSRCSLQPWVTADIAPAENLHFSGEKIRQKSMIKKASINRQAPGFPPSARRLRGNPSYHFGTPSTDSSIDLSGSHFTSQSIRRLGKTRTPTGLDAQTAIPKMSSKHNFNRLMAIVQKYIVNFHIFFEKVLENN